MKLHTINTGLFKLDGGAMFGVVPKSMWQKLNPPDDFNMCTWAMRCLLIEDGKRLILIDTGIGNKQDDKFRSHFMPHGNDTLYNSIRKKGFEPEDITDVVLTHLHFDHCGGAVNINDGKPILAFPNAIYWSSQQHWDWAINPNPREKASFLKENIIPIQENGNLKFIETNDFNHPFISFEKVNGHTESMILVHIETNKYNLSYCADLIPSIHHIRLPFVMAYDVRPLETLKEKASFLSTALQKKSILMFEHDPIIECCTIKETDNGIVFDYSFPLTEID
ncbi:MAG: MBL fold metallo-hydrolase [Bacteroidetes bacterium]|nr:MBL fold metallo-hydrolase [Bacteroidota bacterium]